MPGQLPKDVVQRRFDRLNSAQQQISLERNRESVASVVEVMVEGTSKKDPSKLSGRTRTNKLVHFEDEAAEGDFRQVLVTGAAPSHLEGRLAG